MILYIYPRAACNLTPLLSLQEIVSTISSKKVENSLDSSSFLVL